MGSLLLTLGVLGAVVAVDQASKTLVARRLEEGAFTSRHVFGARLRHVTNRRLPWRSAPAVRVMVVLWIIGTAAALGVAAMVDTHLASLALGALSGGAAGNLIDGIKRNAVTDFIDLRVWPVFNIADAAIVSSAALLFTLGARELWRG